jgi:NitT/TauT family transport system ATP-binding protein
MYLLEIDSLSKTYGEGPRRFAAIGNISFGVKPGELLCVVGPSGCGKTTLVRCLSGLVRPSSGTLSMHGRPIDGPPEQLAVVFQEYGRSLMPWMTVRHNVALPLRHKSLNAARRNALVEGALASVGLSHCMDQYPWQLSGGMQQRVAIARALAYQPQVLLMDEPFASVDAQTRAELEDLILRLRTELGVTVLLVTHDIDEAIYLGDRVVVLTRSPTSVQELLDVDLPAPRDQVTTKMLPRFTELRARVFAEIMLTRAASPRVTATDAQARIPA